MEIIERRIKELKPYEDNPRKNDKAVDALMESIKEFGFKVPIVVDRNDVIVAGHTRYKAAKRLGIKTVPVIVADDLYAGMRLLILRNDVFHYGVQALSGKERHSNLFRSFCGFRFRLFCLCLLSFSSFRLRLCRFLFFLLCEVVLGVSVGKAVLPSA